MKTINIRQRLHQFIDNIEDKKAKAIYTLFADDIDPELKRKDLILTERKKVLKGEGKLYSWKRYKIELTRLATFEIFEAYDWYELQKAGLGEDFLVELDKFYQTLQTNPKTYSYYKKPIREGKVKRFPYTVVYEIFETTIIIYSVFMAKQNPVKKRTK